MNGQDLYLNYNTFYDEYLNNTFSSDFDKVTTLSYSSTLKCITPKANNETYYYTNPLTTLNIKSNDYPRFNYSLNTNNISIFTKPSLSFVYRLYDMKSLLPKIELLLPVKDNDIVKVLANNKPYILDLILAFPSIYPTIFFII